MIYHDLPTLPHSRAVAYHRGHIDYMPCHMFDQEYEKKCAPLMERCKVVLEAAIKAAGVPLDQIDSVEIVGGHGHAKTEWRDVFYGLDF